MRERWRPGRWTEPRRRCRSKRKHGGSDVRGGSGSGQSPASATLCGDPSAQSCISQAACAESERASIAQTRTRRRRQRERQWQKDNSARREKPRRERKRTRVTSPQMLAQPPPKTARAAVAHCLSFPSSARVLFRRCGCALVYRWRRGFSLAAARFFLGCMSATVTLAALILPWPVVFFSLARGAVASVSEDRSGQTKSIAARLVSGVWGEEEHAQRRSAATSPPESSARITGVRGVGGRL